MDVKKNYRKFTDSTGRFLKIIRPYSTASRGYESRGICAGYPFCNCRVPFPKIYDHRKCRNRKDNRRTDDCPDFRCSLFALNCGPKQMKVHWWQDLSKFRKKTEDSMKFPSLQEFVTDPMQVLEEVAHTRKEGITKSEAFRNC